MLRALGTILSSAIWAGGLGIGGVGFLAADEAAAFAQALAEGDGWYARRAEGAQGALARSGPADAAIRAYRRAVALNPGSNEARSRLIRALFFRWSFCGAGAQERRAYLEEARRVADEGCERLEKRSAGAQGAARIEALRGIPGAASLSFWAAVAWGEWALARGKLAAARQGAGTKIRELAETVIALDPQLEEGGGYRVLGRLHDQSPRIPFLSGWVSRQAALSNLRQALAIAPDNSVNQVFLAEAILRHDAAHRQEARALLERCAGASPRPEYLVEDRYYEKLARADLAALRP